MLFGSTILGEGVRSNFLAQKLMNAYNVKGGNNLADRLDDLETGLMKIRERTHRLILRTACETLPAEMRKRVLSLRRKNK